MFTGPTANAMNAAGASVQRNCRYDLGARVSQEILGVDHLE